MKKKLLTVITAFIMALMVSMPCCCAVEQPKAADTQPQIVQKKHKEDRNEAKNVFRKDEVKIFEDNEALLANAKEKERNMFKIPKVIQ